MRFLITGAINRSHPLPVNVRGKFGALSLPRWLDLRELWSSAGFAYRTRTCHAADWDSRGAEAAERLNLTGTPELSGEDRLTGAAGTRTLRAGRVDPQQRRRSSG
jgi:hypothetical protein